MLPGMEPALAILAAALVIDGLFGEYPAPLHPVVWLGKAISLLLRLAPAHGWWRQLAFGVLLAAAVLALGVGLALFALHLAAGRPLWHLVVGTFFLKSSFALRELVQAADR